MAELPSVISIIDCSNEAAGLVADDSLTFTVTQDNDGIPCAYIIHVPVSADTTTLLTDTVCQANIVSEDIKHVVETNPATFLPNDTTVTTDAHLGMQNATQTCTLVTATGETIFIEEDTVVKKEEGFNVAENETNNQEQEFDHGSLETLASAASAIFGNECGDNTSTVRLDEGVINAPENITNEEDGNENKNKKGNIAASTTATPPATTKKPVLTYGKHSKASKSKEPTKSQSLVKVGSCSEVVVKTPEAISIPLRPRKRRLIIDTHKQIPIGDFKEQLKNTKDIMVEKHDMAPPTKKAMKIMENGHVAKIFCTPGRDLKHVPLYRLFYSRLVIAPETENKPINTLVPLNADLQITQPSSENDVTGEKLSLNVKSEFLLLREKAYSTGKASKNPRPKLSFKGAKNPPAFKQYTAKKRKPSGTVKTADTKEEQKIDVSRIQDQCVVKSNNSPNSNVPIILNVSTVSKIEETLKNREAHEVDIKPKEEILPTEISYRSSQDENNQSEDLEEVSNLQTTKIEVE